MRSKASVGGHPLHPALIPFPFAFLCGSFGFDVAGRLFDRPALWTTGFHLAVAGIVTGLVAAVPGFVDYAVTVPPSSSGRRRATWHMVLALATVGVFVVAVWLRDATSPPSLPMLALEGIAVALLSAGGWMGGTLVVRDQISVDHRYAGGREWSETTAKRDADGRVPAATCEELAVDQMKLIHVEGRRVVLARTTSGYVAFDDACPHSGGSLAGGTMVCGTVQCPWHGSQFDTCTGAVRAGPATQGIKVYRAAAEDGTVRIAL